MTALRKEFKDVADPLIINKMLGPTYYADLNLKSPAGPDNPPHRYIWTGCGKDIHDTINLIRRDIPDLNDAMNVPRMLHLDTTSYESMTWLCQFYNAAIDTVLILESSADLHHRLSTFANRDLLRKILQLVYNTSVTDPQKLNKYESFSTYVYGEATFELVSQIVDHIEIGSDDVFIDLGSGIGQVVLQIAAAVPLKMCFGIELADTPSMYAVDMDLNFRAWMKWFGKNYSDYQLIKGDFLSDEHREKITGATLIFVNNFAFEPIVNNALKKRFAGLSNRVKIVSSQRLCSSKFRINDRTLTDIGAILNVSELPPFRGSVSWTDKPVTFYVNSIDRSKLESYYQKKNSNNGSSAKLACTNAPSKDKSQSDDKENNISTEETDQGNDVQLTQIESSASNRGNKRKLGTRLDSLNNVTTKKFTAQKFLPESKCPQRDDIMHFKSVKPTVSSSPMMNVPIPQNFVIVPIIEPRNEAISNHQTECVVLEPLEGDGNPFVISSASSSIAVTRLNNPVLSNPQESAHKNPSNMKQPEENKAAQHCYGRGCRSNNRKNNTGASSSLPDPQISKKSLYETYNDIVNNQSLCTSSVFSDQNLVSVSVIEPRNEAITNQKTGCGVVKALGKGAQSVVISSASSSIAVTRAKRTISTKSSSSKRLARTECLPGEQKLF